MKRQEPLDAIIVEEIEPVPPPIHPETLARLKALGGRVRYVTAPRPSPGVWIKQEVPTVEQPHENSTMIVALAILGTLLYFGLAGLLGYLDATYSITGNFGHR